METAVMPIIIVKAMWEFKSAPFLWFMVCGLGGLGQTLILNFFIFLLHTENRQAGK